MGYFSEGLGKPVWEEMPTGEDDPIARRARESYLGRLVPLSRFILLAEDGIHYSEGLAYPGHKDGAQDVSIAVSPDLERKALWTNPDKRPWRQLTALLSFYDANSQDGYDCRLLRRVIPRASSVGIDLTLWSGGLKVSSNAGEQYISGGDDFVESEVTLKASWLGEAWFQRLKLEMEALSNLGNAIFGSVASYYKELKADGKGPAAKASEGFWADCESVFQDLVEACGSSDDATRADIRVHLARYAETRYDRACPRESARQIESWATHRVSTWRYLHALEAGVAASQKPGAGKRKKA
jgi:CRISPR system Cascade subunit CasA